jgi:TonB-linked outer membrane protein, SusC/RagA family
MIAQLNPKQIMNINFSPKHINKKLPLLLLLIFSFVLVIPSQILAQGTVVSGKITSSTGDPLQGVSVQVKGSKKGTSTDNNGQFSLSVPSPDATLVVTSAGYTRMEVKVEGRNIVPISMTTSTRELEQVVVIGYGSASKRDLTGSIVKVSGKEVADKPNTNPVSSLQGKVAGLSVVNNGIPGQAPDIRIRGTVSIGSTHPLYVVNGIFSDNIDFLNPNDIESIEVLKDPSSLAIFGVKGASGVIAITTKQAKAGQLVVNFNTSFGVKKLVDKIQLASGAQFRSILAAEAANGLNDPDPSIGQKNTDFLNNELPKWTGNTDWVDALTRTANFNSTNISVSSATENNKFYMGTGFTSDEGIVKHVKYERVNFNINEEAKVSKSLKFGFNLVASRESLPYGSDQLDDARRTLPIINSDTKSYFAKNPYGNDSLNIPMYEGVPVIQNTEHNPLMVVENEWDKLRDIKYRFVPSVYGEINLTKSLSFKASVYGDLSNEDKRFYTPLYYSYNPAAAVGGDAVSLYHKTTSVEENQYNVRSLQGDYIFNYRTHISDHSITATAGFTHFYYGFFQTNAKTIQQASDNPIPNNERLWYISSGFGTPSSPTSSQHEYATISGLIRVLYNYKSKYFVNASFRRDGASGINSVYSKKFQNFWAVGAAWEMTKETFLENQKVFDVIKLKGSWGHLGNFNTLGNDYPAYPGLGYSNAQFGGNTVTVANPNYLVDPNLRWEVVTSKEIGVEFGAFTNRLHAEVLYYNKRTDNLLAFLKPSGVSPTLTNSGQIQNKGFEFSANWNQRFSRDLSLTIGGNLTTYHNKVLTLTYPTNLDPQVPNQAKEGYPIGSFFGYVVEGLYQSYNDILKSPVYKGSGTAPTPGDFKYKDLNGDGIIDDRDQTIIGNPTPDFAYGASMTLHFVGIDLGIDVGGVYGNEIYRYWGTSEQKNSVYNYPAYYTQGWTGPGTSNWYPIVDAQHTINRVPSTYAIEDGSYFRIRNLQLGYNINSDVLKRVHIQNFKIFANVQNLKTWKRNLGYSPEYGGDAFSFGIDRGDATGALPRIITGGINVTF